MLHTTYLTIDSSSASVCTLYLHLSSGWTCKLQAGFEPGTCSWETCSPERGRMRINQDGNQWCDESLSSECAEILSHSHVCFKTPSWVFDLSRPHDQSVMSLGRFSDTHTNDVIGLEPCCNDPTHIRWSSIVMVSETQSSCVSRYEWKSDLTVATSILALQSELMSQMNVLFSGPLNTERELSPARSSALSLESPMNERTRGQWSITCRATSKHSYSFTFVLIAHNVAKYIHTSFNSPGCSVHTVHVSVRSGCSRLSTRWQHNTAFLYPTALHDKLLVYRLQRMTSRN